MNKTKTNHLNLGKRWKVMFWITLGMLLLFTVTPRGKAQSLPDPVVNTPTVTEEQKPAVEAAPVVAPVEAIKPAAETPEEIKFPYTKTFIISGYYTPLPGQSRYATGSFEGDVRLNGEGVHSADGSHVYPGMLAAPKNYPFGTKMEIPGFGIVAVHDRGGAIKNNRLDIWVGEGDEGLRRALGWGMRTLKVTVYGIDPSIKESVNIAGLPLANISRLSVSTVYFNVDLGEGDEGENVAELKRFLRKFGFLEAGKDSPVYFGKETSAAITKFQIDQKVIDSANDYGAGNFGPKTRIALESFMNVKKADALKILPQITLKKGDSNDDVKNLQKSLNDLGFKTELTGVFDDNTYAALVRFQLDTGLIAKEVEVGAGYYGPKTQTSFEKLITNSFTPSVAQVPVKQTPVKDTAVVVQLPDTFTKPLTLNDKGPEVAILQEELGRLNFFGLKPTGFFGATTEHAVFKFQQAFSIVEDEKTMGAGIVGPKTADVLNEIIAKRTNQQKIIAATMEKKELVDSRIEDERSLIVDADKNLFIGDLTYGYRGSDVARLQGILKKLGFFPGKITTEYFGDITKTSLTAFQKNHGIEPTGNLDPDTRRILNKIIASV
ncbi:MAG: peptidoglycan-binding protein [Candidatus Gracilibacteria bacterium]